MDFSKANQERFDTLAAEYDTKPWQQKMAAQLTEQIRNRLDWLGVDWASQDHDSQKDGREVRLLDYACGTGMIARALGPYVTTTIGIDISPNMVTKFNSLAASAGLPPSRLCAVVGDLLCTPPTPSVSAPRFFDFDVAAVCAGFHHFADAALATRRLAERLKPGGVLLIVDFLGTRKEDVPEEMRKTVRVGGFEEEGMKEFFEGAGLLEFGFSLLEEKVVMEMKGERKERVVFMARGRKPGK